MEERLLSICDGILFTFMFMTKIWFIIDQYYIITANKYD